MRKFNGVGLLMFLGASLLHGLIAFHSGSVAEATEIILAIGGERTEGYDPITGWGRYGSPLFQSTLLRRDTDLNIVPDLAEDYSLSEDRLTWTIRIRKDVKFSDGTPLTAKDVAYTFNQAAKSGGKVDVTVLDKAVAVKDDTVEFHLTQPWITFIEQFITLGIVPEHAYGPDYGRHPIGSGPYTLVHWAEGQQMIVEANPFYYGHKPSIDRLVFLFTDEDTSFAAAKAGKVHVVAVPQMLAVQRIPGMHIHPVPSVDNRGLMFPVVPDNGEISANGAPLGNTVTADPAIRQAANYAIDRQALVDGILEGFGTPAFSLVDGLPWEQPEARFQDANLDKARQILAENGWKDSDGDGIVEKNGIKAEFTLIHPSSDSTRQNLALACADMLKEAGIRVDVQGKSWDEIDMLKHSNAVVLGWGSHNPTELYNLYHSSMRGVEYFNPGYYHNSAVDEYLDQAMSASSFEEAVSLWKSAQWDGTSGFITAGDAPWAWLVNLTHTYFVSDCLDIGTSQIEPHGHGWPLTANITQWKWTCE
ncbi:nickel ABC transporter substrate-binding protein [candidate division KSB3 bacterium]|uniref:Nickel ABC transporter substrate-binding protein n=1 Tax=candidate division KSB3 bacterium TaxID=2044937 RepID=A0A2G6E777_9BACT|nr:MAG: nickel ABC transporter substrate-binding protein [candidate division KSB3 bacterium]PIE30146.1 MAG: nickel ABC transporter substrate-binding protein [candidate division KSB3 bacterium]